MMEEEWADRRGTVSMEGECGGGGISGPPELSLTGRSTTTEAVTSRLYYPPFQLERRMSRTRARAPCRAFLRPPNVMKLVAAVDHYRRRGSAVAYFSSVNSKTNPEKHGGTDIPKGGTPGGEAPVRPSSLLPAINPQGTGYIAWLVVVTLCYYYNACCIPLRECFLRQQEADTWKYWMAADYFSDLIYLIDLVFVKPRLMFLEEGLWVTDISLTSTNYWTKAQYKLRIGRSVFYIFFFIHLNACAFRKTDAVEKVNHNITTYLFYTYHASRTFVTAGLYRPRPTFTFTIAVSCLSSLLIFAFLIGQIYEIFETASRAQIEHRDRVDRCVQYLKKLNVPKPEICRVTDWFAYIWKQQHCFAEQKNKILKEKNIELMSKPEYSPDMATCDFFLFAKIKNLLRGQRFSSPEEAAEEYEKHVSEVTREEWHKCFRNRRIANTELSAVQHETGRGHGSAHMSTLSKVEVFHGCSQALLRELVLQLRPVSFLPGDVVVRRGDVGHHMYIVKSGVCCVMSPDEREVLATLREGSVFGEVSLLGIEGARRRTATVRSRGYSSLFALSKANLDRTLLYDREAALVLRRRADQIMRENATRQARNRLKNLENQKKLRRSQKKNLKEF
ncbi:Cyclic nucleotide-gated olfactory channel [Eumeta japonica]|uniref:Cyclic nucleotide-gated olfactory channel n=1 Tax=Eumeta variegata TaxID=151549 RepID=A0A4C1U2V5_EUMVA|nr:Cyclic nucleotide-gated olfactory channel [Eumeta japonica]